MGWRRCSAYRAQGAFLSLRPDPLTEHECGDSRYLAMPFFDFWLEQRLPAIDAADPSLRPVESGGELGKRRWAAS